MFGSEAALTLHLVEERRLHYYGFTLTWPATQKGNGYLNVKPKRTDGQQTRAEAPLLALQHIQGELEGREFTHHPEVMTAIDRHIKRVAKELGGGAHHPIAPATTWIIDWDKVDQPAEKVGSELTLHGDNALRMAIEELLSDINHIKSIVIRRA